MGKTSRWFRSLLGSKKPPPESSSVGAAPPPKERKKGKWALLKPADSKFENESDPLESLYIEGLDANKHAIAVAAATAAVAEAALAAAQAAAEVVRLTSGGGSGVIVPAYYRSDWRRVEAAIKIQSAFRAYLARRALRALKGLVKLQALVRGRIVRKQSADMLRRMQAMARIQARASAHRSYVSVSSKTNIRFSNSRPQGVVNARNYYQRSDNAKHGGYNSKQIHEYNSRSSINKESSHLASNWLNHWMEQYSWNNRHATTHEAVRGDDERSDKILEIDTWKPRQTPRRYDKRQEYSKISSSKLHKPNPSASSEVSSVISQKVRDQVEAWTAESSPKVHSASSRPTSDVRGSFTPTRSECSRSLFGDYLSHPNYMANTESSRAKVRSQSAPRQRMQLDELGVSSTFCHNQWESDAVSEKGFPRPTNYTSSTRNRGPPSGLSSSYGYRL